MKILSDKNAIFKVKQAVGSMAIEGVVLSEQQQKKMLDIVQGKVSAASLRAQWLAKYAQFE